MTNNNQPNQNSTWEKIVAILLASVVLVTFIFYVINPFPTADATLAIIRFLAATFSGLAAFLFVGDLNLEGTIPGLDNKVKVRAAGGFATFLLVFFLFFYGIQPSANGNLPNSQPVTLFGSYPTLALFDPVKPTVPEILAKELDIQKTPIIFKKSPVFDSIQKFIIETGNQNFISDINKPLDMELRLRELYSFNYKNKTKSSINENVIDQSKGDFELDFLIGDGDQGTEIARYNPIESELSTDIIEASWTAISQSPFATDTIIQYPQLKNIRKSYLTEQYLQYFDSSYSSDTWIKKVIEANPDLRGLVGYQYEYLTNLSKAPYQCGGFLIRSVFSDLFIPYVKFIDIVNYTQKPIQLNSITYKIANQEANPYQLTDATHRSTLFKSGSTKKEQINVILQAGRHYIIPIEFGFEFSRERQPTTRQLSQKVIYIAKLLPKNSQGESDIPEPPDDPDASKVAIENYYKAITQEVKLSDDFLAKMKSSKNDIPIPHRLAIGSILDIESLIADNRKIFIPKPADEFSSFIAKGIGSGSCPYLLVYDASKGYWIDLGTVLYSRASKTLQDTEIHTLGNQTTKIKLEERENEITYIDSLAILYTETDTGVNREIIPSLPNIHQIDGQYLVLNKGENIEIEFRNLIPNNAINIQLKINGYYNRISHLS